MGIFSKHSEIPKTEIVISFGTVFRVLTGVVLLILGLAALRQISTALVLIFTAFFLALALNAPVHWIGQNLPGKRRGSRVAATTISYVFVVLLIAGFLLLVVPPAGKQIALLFESTPQFIHDLQDTKTPTGIFIRDNNLDGIVRNFSNDISSYLEKSGSAAIATVSQVGASIVSLIAVLAMTFMMLVEGPRWARILRKLLPVEHQQHATVLARDMYGVVKGFVNGQVALASIAALIILPVMLILNIPYAGALAVIVFIAGLVPMIGHFIGASVITLIALFESPVSAVMILSFYILYQQIENYVIQPRVQSNTTNISPLLVIIAVVIGINMGGILGGLVAIPVMACLRILALDYLQRTGRISASDTNLRHS